MLVRPAAAIKTARLILAGIVLLALPAAASAASLTFVSADGNDANPCTVVSKPCKTLQRAVNQVAANGTVRLLTSFQGNLAIAKSVAIEGGGATLIGAVVVNSSTAVVTLRNIALSGGGNYASGIRIDAAASVRIEDCTVERYTNDGIKLVATTGTKLVVVNTASHDNGSDGLYVDAINSSVEIQNSRFEANASTGIFLKTRRASVIGSVSSANGANGIIQSAGSTNYTETTAVNNGSNGFYILGAGGILSSSVSHGNLGWGLYIATGATAIITDTVIAQNSTGIRNDGTLNTFRDNQLIRNNSFAYQGSGLKQDETAF